MNINWKRNAAAIIVSAAVLVSAQPLAVIASDSVIAFDQEVSYTLDGSIKAGVESVVYERTGEGSRIGTVVRLTNEGGRIARVPEYELRVQTENGAEYVLTPSLANPMAIQPKETVELLYIAEIDTVDKIKIASLVWVEIDEYVYPKLEKKKLSIPVASAVWNGGGQSEGGRQVPVKAWGDVVSLPQVSGQLSYKGVRVSEEHTSSGTVTLLRLEVENKGTLRRALPQFRLDGMNEQKLYKGSRVEKDPLFLEPGEKGYVHFAIKSDRKVSLQKVLLQSEETFLGENEKKIPYVVGWLEMTLPAVSGTADFVPYTLHTPIAFDPVNTLVPKDVDVSLEQLHLLESSVDGYKAVNAKFKLTNKQDQPVPLPNFQAELLSADGSRYAGAQTAGSSTTLPPRLSYMAEYTFVLPEADAERDVKLILSDALSLEPYKLPIAQIRTKVQHEDTDGTVSIYPYNLTFEGADIRSSIKLVNGDFVNTYEVNLHVKADRMDQTLHEPNQGQLRVELIGRKGEERRRLGSQMVPLKPDPWSGKGVHTLLFPETSNFGGLTSLNIYESVTTPFGTAERLVKTIED